MSEKSTRLLRRLEEYYGDPTEELHHAYSPWLEDMSRREGASLVPFEFDENKYPEQSVRVAVTSPHEVAPWLPDRIFYGGFRIKMARSLGFAAIKELTEQALTQPASTQDATPIAERLSRDQDEGKNTIIVTSHFRFAEMGYFRGIEFIAKKDRQRVHKTGVLLNKLMSRQSYKGKALCQHFTTVGEVLWTYPRSASSEKYSIPTGATNLGNALFMDALERRLTTGGYELHASLAGSEIKPIYDEDGSLSHYDIPDVQPGSAKLLEGFDSALPVTVIQNPDTGKWQMGIGELIDVQELLKSSSPAEVADIIYADITQSVEEFTKQDVVYRPLAKRLGKVATQNTN